MRWKRSLVLIFWLVGILFPMAWLEKFSSNYGDVFNIFFSPEWMHWVMHAALYAGLAVFVIWIFELPINWQTLGIVVLTGLGNGVLQEGVQIFAGVQVLRWNTLFDLGVDTLGALIGFGLVARNRKRHANRESARR